MIFWTSDTHFGHEPIVSFCGRPYTNADEMNEGILETWNKTVARGDTVYHLGDVSFLGSDRTLAILGQLNGTIHLVRGNHDSTMAARVREQFASVSEYKEIKIPDDDTFGGTRLICMSHYPMLSWRNSYRGESWMLHGHCHARLELSLPDRPGPKRLDVGWDVWRRPVSLDELRLAMGGRTGVPSA